jgi:hypothetical protein
VEAGLDLGIITERDIVIKVESSADRDPKRVLAFLLNLMQTGIVTETKYGKTRLAEMNVR